MIAIRMMPERQCFGCSKQDEWGCTARRWREPDPGQMDRPEYWVNPAKQPQTIDGETTYACPRQPLMEEPHFWSQLLKYFAMYQKGFMPDDGGVNQQSNRAVVLFDAMDTIQIECDNAIRDKERNKRNRQIPQANAKGRQNAR